MLFEENVILILFLSVMASIFIFETLFPRKKRLYSRLFRWSNNILIILIDKLVVLIIPFSLSNYTFQYSLFKLVNLNSVILFIISFIILDIIIYFQHRLFHVNNFFWKLHLMHHTDQDLDFTSALRFHPFEILLSIIIKSIAVYILGINITTLIIFETCTSLFAIFNHGNFKINDKLEKMLRLVIITPDLHRIHHSIFKKECNSNYGTIFTFWDKVFKTFVSNSKIEQTEMILGILGYDEKKYSKIHWMLITPFLRNKHV